MKRSLGLDGFRLVFHGHDDIDYVIYTMWPITQSHFHVSYVCLLK